MVTKINEIEEFEQLLNEHNRFFFLKHSLTCPVSGNAYDEYVTFINNENIDGYYLAVQESRSLSNYIAEKFGIKHESPQAFLFIDGKPGWTASHWNITQKALKQL
ncbi:bacillithiol system protein YtxJ [Bacillus pakistanensis]|uniref:Bacillithiol system protein YtxJ n=1 Tax=Rossellomorea pakistanensis TaxID=992288 RepID=A0ABS2NB10_9BACI|nr:bacillithiol system redox-active protein YtxJ [Bacillus pakistanensis]MBM7585010.1 bacillithiol system protein YtxJ [Bacillus pakistanensis]